MIPIVLGAAALLLMRRNPPTAPVMSYARAHAWEPQAAERKVSVVARSARGFMRAYQRAGSWSKLSPWWQRRRNNFVARHLAQAGINGERLWEQVRGRWRPTRRGLALIMWAAMPPGRPAGAKPMTTNPRARAPKGGIVGVNQEFYEGGKFLPSHADRAKQAPAHMAKGRKAEIGPRQWAVRPEDWTMPLYPVIRHFIDHHHLQRTGQAVIIANETALAHYGGRDSIQKNVDLFNRGVRWLYTGEHPRAGQPVDA